MRKRGLDMLPDMPYQLDKMQKLKRDYVYNCLLDLVDRVACKLPEKGKALDVGCGRGEIMAALSARGFTPYGIDLDEKCVELSEKLGNVVHGDAHELGRIFGKERFNVVISCHTLEHFYNPKNVVEQMKAVCDGWIILAVPNCFFLPNLIRIVFGKKIPPTHRGHYFEWDVSNFKNFVEEHCGLTISELKYDWVKTVPTRKLRELSHVLGFLSYLEANIMVRFLPHVSESIMALCKCGR